MAKSTFEMSFKSKNYDAMQQSNYLAATLGGLDLLNRAYSKLGLDANYFSVQPSLKLTGFDFGELTDKKPVIKYFKKDNKYVSDIMHVTYLLFGGRQLYIYNYAFNSDYSLKEEMLTEIFYKDISSVSVESSQVNCTDTQDTAYIIPNTYFCLTFGAEKLAFPVNADFDVNNEELFIARKFIRDKKFLG